MEISHSVIISLGSNLGDRINFLRQAIELMQAKMGSIGLMSAVYETPPWGFETDNSFLNMCLELNTKLKPLELLDGLKSIESELGREKSVGTTYSSRIIDLDIILYNQVIFSCETLTVPHPRYTGRRFVLQPLNDIAPNRIDPITHLSISQLLANCNDRSEIQHYSKGF